MEYNFVGGRYAVLVLAAIVLLPGAAVSMLLGGVLGGVIGIIDRALLAVAHLRFVSPPRR